MINICKNKFIIKLITNYKKDYELELKNNEAYGSSYTHYIPTEDNVAYGQVSNKSTQL